MHSKEPRHSSWETVSFLRPVPKPVSPQLDPHPVWALAQRLCPVSICWVTNKGMNISLWAAWNYSWGFWFKFYTAFPRCPLISGCRLQSCKYSKWVLPRGNSQAWGYETHLTVGVLAHEHHAFLFLGNFSHMEKPMSSLWSHLWYKKKSCQDKVLTENFRATEGHFSGKGNLSSIVFKRQFIIRSSRQGVPGIRTLCLTQNTQHLVRIKQKEAKKMASHLSEC